ncbi:IPT/TIG domain-containing protein [Prevotella melaninogenica]|uniref:IPT/TIG domain-containing protein n=1 Tax=Prevotella melaninogenica TaxID=28132 RepID=UPI001BAA613D|nr:IPT/TIG domain-containing protein [Prevotella melaninogenica]QUB60699.1 IPT/TIG domain-containing protein [Prevotella melaninogenica]
MKRLFKSYLWMVLMGSLAWVSCSDKEVGGTAGTSFDPSQPIVISDFYPDSGGIATPMIITGKNFGTDTTGLALWYVDEDGGRHRGGLVSSNGEKLYCYVPAGLTYKRNIKLEVTRANGADTIKGAGSRDFKYITQTAVTTIVGTQTSDAHATKIDKLLTSNLSAPGYLCVDNDNNIFIVQHRFDDSFKANGSDAFIECRDEKNENVGGMVLKADLKRDQISILQVNSKKDEKINAPAYSTLDGYEGVYVPDDNGRKYYSLLKAQGYAVHKQQFINPNGYANLDESNWKYCFVINKNDQMIYSVMFKGQLIRINPKTRKAELLLKRVGKDGPKGSGGSDAFCTFSPTQPNRLFISFTDAHQIWYVDVDQLSDKDSLTYAGEPYAGISSFGTVNVTEGKGWEDGALKNAKFCYPRQMTFTKDGKLYIADSGNHCIRMIDTTQGKNARVTTPIGVPQSAGFHDGGVELAKFNWPTGVAVSADGSTVYVADSKNQVIRELSIK